MRAEAQRTEMTGTRLRQRLRAAQFDDDDGRIEGEEGEGRGDKRPMDGDGTRSRRDQKQFVAACRAYLEALILSELHM